MATLTQLEYVLAVNQYRHFGKAADACHVSQPTLSQQLQKLEDELGVILFDRLQKPILPTPAGEGLIAQAKRVIQEHDRFLQLAKKSTEEVSGEFRLGMIPTLSTDLIPLFVEKFSQLFPKVELFIEELKTATILKELESDHLDAGILAGPLHQEGFKVHPLFYENFILYVSPGHLLCKKGEIESSDLDGSEMWMLTDGNCLRNQVINFCSLPSRGGPWVLRNIHFESGNLETLRQLVSKSKGYTLLPQLMKQRLSAQEIKNQVKNFAHPMPSREVVLVYRRDHWKLDIIRALEDVITASLPPEVSREKSPSLQVLEIV